MGMPFYMRRTAAWAASLFLLCSARGTEPYSGFEQNADGWSPSPGSSITRTGRHCKEGNHSLQWTWNAPESALSYSFAPCKTARTRNASTHFAFWLYHEKERKERLYVDLYQGNALVVSCWFNMDYRGWRVMGINMELLGAAPGTGFSKAVFRTNSPSGTVWLDAVRPALLSSPVQPDDQQPWANHPAQLQTPPAQTRYSGHDIHLNRPWLPPFIPAEKIGAGSRANMERLERHYFQNMGHGGTNYRDFPELKRSFKLLKIREKGNAVTGKPLALSDNGFHTIPGSVDFKKTFLPLFRNLAAAAHREQGENRRKAEEMYILMCRHFLDQGFQEGNGNFGWIGNGYGYRHFSPAVFAHRDLLSRSGILDRMAKSISFLNMGQAMLSETPYSSCDQFYNYSSHLPAAILMIPDEAERYQRLRAFKHYLDVTIGKNGMPFGRDGTAHHHTGHHLSYGGYTPPSLLHTQILPFRDTEFRISREAQEKLRTYARACAFQIMHGQLAPNLYLRSGAPMPLNIASTALRLAQLGNPDNPSEPDREMAGIYLAALEQEQPPEAGAYRSMGITPIRSEGHMSLNLAATGLHRRDGWQAAVVGMLRNHRGLEIYGWTESNNYGRYSRNGSMFVTIGRETGWRRSGWNWNHWPAGTNPVRESHELFEGYALFSNRNNMAGGVEMDGNGIWGNDFDCRDAVFKKSAFFFGDLITIITTDIKPTRPEGKNIVTTLFQQSTEAERTTLLVNGKPSTNSRQDGSSPTFLRDLLGNCYYIHPGPPVLCRIREQEWTYFNRKDLKDPGNNPCMDIRKKQFRESPLSANAAYYHPTRGTFALAYLDHGTDPEGASCCYTMQIAPAPEQERAFMAAVSSGRPPVEILRKNAAAHVVLHPSTATTGYVVFSPCSTLPGPLKSVDRPGFIMVRDLGDRYRVSLATGDPEQNREYRLEFHDGIRAILTPDYPLSATVEVTKKRASASSGKTAAASARRTNPRPGAPSGKKRGFPYFTSSPR